MAAQGAAVFGVGSIGELQGMRSEGSVGAE